MVQRAFSTFPSGRPGVGLLLLRLVIGVAMLAEGATCLATPARTTAWTWVVGLLGFAVGLALLVGFLTPVAGVLAALLGLASLAWPPADSSVPSATFLIVLGCLVATAVCLLGPGAFSVDAHRFGRREIRIPGD